MMTIQAFISTPFPTWRLWKSWWWWWRCLGDSPFNTFCYIWHAICKLHFPFYAQMHLHIFNNAIIFGKLFIHNNWNPYISAVSITYTNKSLLYGIAWCRPHSNAFERFWFTSAHSMQFIKTAVFNFNSI